MKITIEETGKEPHVIDDVAELILFAHVKNDQDDYNTTVGRAGNMFTSFVSIQTRIMAELAVREGMKEDTAHE